MLDLLGVILRFLFLHTFGRVVALSLVIYFGLNYLVQTYAPQLSWLGLGGSVVLIGAVVLWWLSGAVRGRQRKQTPGGGAR